MSGEGPRVRSVAELRDVDDPAWPGLWLTLTGARVPVRVLEVDPSAGERTLCRLQVSARSTLGALALHTGGLLVDHGWVRVLGGGSELPDLATASGLGDPGEASEPPPWLTVGYDVLGGRFAVDGGGLGVRAGEVCHWGADTLRWEGLGVGHTAFVHAAVDGALSDLYEPFRWPGWQDDVSAVAPDQGLALYPPPFTVQGQDPAAVHRRPVPFVQLLAFGDDMAAQLGGQVDGQGADG